MEMQYIIPQLVAGVFKNWFLFKISTNKFWKVFTFSAFVIFVLKPPVQFGIEMGSDLTLEYFWSAVNIEPTPIFWPRWDFFYPKRQKIEKFGILWENFSRFRGGCDPIWSTKKDPTQVKNFWPGPGITSLAGGFPNKVYGFTKFSWKFVI